MPNWKKVIVSGSNAHFNSVTASSGIQLADDAVLNIGDGNDLQLYHDGNNSYIKEINGANGQLYMDSENKIRRRLAWAKLIDGKTEVSE